MKSFYTEGIKNFCESLFSNTEVTVSGHRINTLDSGIVANLSLCCCTSRCNANLAVLYIKKDEEQCFLVTIQRIYFSFSKKEKKLLKAITETINKSGFDWNLSRSEKTVQGLLSKIAIPYAIISKFLRGSGAPTIDTVNKILLLSEDLTNKKYEGDKCTSGIIYTSQIKEAITILNSQNDYQYNKFDTPIQLNDDFFEKPASYRYIDGKNNFYLVDNSSKVYGIVRITNPACYSLIDRLSSKHISPLIELLTGRPWVVYNGINDDVCLYKKGNYFINRKNNKWYYFDYDNFELLLSEFGISQNIIPIIISTCLSLSNLHKGSLFLFPFDSKNLPNRTGVIDKTVTANSIKKLFNKMQINELYNSNILLNLLSSDGLSIFSRTGSLIDSGIIIDLSSVNTNSISTNLDKYINNKPSINTIYGGGRTQSALVTSQYGLCIKVSEDGPISVFYKKHCIYKYY
ncbi:MAG: hypothetical protein MJ174_10785 [Treponema sp.]|nr:hypothetical protein [Treponema sp.]